MIDPYKEALLYEKKIVVISILVMYMRNQSNISILMMPPNSVLGDSGFASCGDRAAGGDGPADEYLR